MSITPDTAYNFSRVSARDALAFGCSRPGFPSEEVAIESVKSWSEYMKGRGIKRVLSLLGDDEKAYYKDLDIDEVMMAEFGERNYARTSVFKEGARQVMSDALTAAREANETIAIHCSGGSGRAGLGMGLWLVDTYGLAPEDAATEIAGETERNPGIKRKVKAEKLAYLVTNGSMVGFS